MVIRMIVAVILIIDSEKNELCFMLSEKKTSHFVKAAIRQQFTRRET